MANIKLHSSGLTSFTSVPNIFIDKYMTNANGEYIKIYLYLLRCLGNADKDFSILALADIFEHTEADILRALNYWEKQSLISLEFDDDKNLTGIQLANPYIAEVPVTNDTVSLEVVSEQPIPQETKREPDKSDYSIEEVEEFQDNEAVQEILFITENYLGRTLNSTDIRTILYWYDGLKFSTDLIEYLIETCISNGHTSLRYMEKIALSWAEEGITSVSQARAAHTLHSQSVYGVMHAFGISGRNLIASEVKLVEKWTDEFAFSMEIVKEACRRTITSTGKASFEYADTILTNWHKNDVHNLDDVVKLDSVHKANSAKAKENNSQNTQTPNNSRFHNFPQRTYDYDQLEKQLTQISG